MLVYRSLLLLILDNYDSFTWNLVHLVGQVAPRVPVRVIRNDECTPGDIAALGPSHILISPGPCTPREAGISVDLVRTLAGRVPILGVCLGHQCLGEAFGMRIVRAPEPIHGLTSDVEHDGRSLFAGLPSPLRAMRYHSLVIDESSVPRGWSVSAWTVYHDAAARIVMAIRRDWPSGTHRALLEGVQFHPESFLTEHGEAMMANFLRGPLLVASADTPAHAARTLDS